MLVPIITHIQIANKLTISQLILSTDFKSLGETILPPGSLLNNELNINNKNHHKQIKLIKKGFIFYA